MMEYDRPQPFSDNSWLAVKAGVAEEIAQMLNLSDLTPATWHRGLGAVCGDFWDFKANINAPLSRVFISPHVSGWRLVIGGWVGGSGEAGPTPDEVADYCRCLSRRFGAAHAFTEQGRMDWYQWILAWQGEVHRLFIWDGAPVRDEGSIPSIELTLRQRQTAGDTWSPLPGDVGAIAGEFSVDPETLGAATVSAGQGFLALTEWGRVHGVPKRSLE